MKKLLLIFGIGISALAFLPNQTNAQLRVNVNIGSQPLWGPVGYDRADNYYLPDIESYYNVPTRRFYYLNNGNWVSSSSLPSRYQNYNLYNGYKVVINQPNPYTYFKNHKVKYAKYKVNKSQQFIRQSNDPRYYQIKGHPHGRPPGQAKKDNRYRNVNDRRDDVYRGYEGRDRDDDKDNKTYKGNSKKSGKN